MLGNFFKVVLIVKNLPTNAGDKREAGLILKSRRSSGREKWRRNKYSCLKTPWTRKAWQATIHGLSQATAHGISESDMTEQLNTHTHTHTHTHI